ncbi:MAG: PD-(D/E)XK nuclease family protein [Polaromonas sp.]|nr:PD-(D/E)XK nuclease family protein [Polaromonas sp.]
MPLHAFSDSLDFDPPPTPSVRCWRQAMARLASILEERQLHPAEAVVLVPYAQLIQHALRAWAEIAGGSAFVPRFETTMNWATGLGGTLGMFTPSGVDLRMDVSVDMLTAASLLTQAGLSAQQDVLAGRLVEAAWSLGRVAAAVRPAERQAWSESLAEALGVGLDSPVLGLEVAVGSLALAWAAASSYASDRLFQAEPALFVVLEGFQTEPVSEALRAHFGERAFSIALCPPLHEFALPDAPLPALHAAKDAEDEAARAAACVLAHLSDGRSPVALIAQDRQLTRRVGAMLAQRGIAMRDETGWKLSTTRAAATLMGLLRALVWDVSTDAVLDWLKNAPAFPPGPLAAAESELRKAGVRVWRDLPSKPLPMFAAAQLLAVQVNALRAALFRARPLGVWLTDLRAALSGTGQWDSLMRDEAGQRVLDVLRLHEGAEQEFADQLTAMKLNEFTSWVNQALEAQTFSPEHPAAEQVVIFPLPQLLARPVQAVVLPGCDELRLPVSPEPPGHWTPTQRELLGLPSREALTSAARQAWDYALQLPHLDVLWRTSEAGEHLMPSGFIQELLLTRHLESSEAPDPRSLRPVAARPTPRPLPTGEALPVARLSASAYDDLRRCPYRFFALRQLKLQSHDELEGELSKRDFGNWLHSLLHLFHEALKAAPTPGIPERSRMMDAAATQATYQLGLSGDSEFLPFAAAWVPVRDGYLDWLAGHETTGATFDIAEQWLEMPLGTPPGALTLVGKIDRIDLQSDGQQLLIDYKTEPRTTTVQRINSGAEDTQLAFYAALIPDDTLAAAYVNLGEKEPTRTYDQPDIVELRDTLIENILQDMARIAEGEKLPALGEGSACDYCAARGLCRKDFWNGDQP